MSTEAPTYRRAIEWIALNDEPTYELTSEILSASGLTVAIVADLFGKREPDVASAVQRYRRSQKG